MSSEKPKRGRYNNDYSPKFSEPYDIYDKAREHMKDLRKENLRSEDSFKEQKNAEIPSQKKKHSAFILFAILFILLIIGLSIYLI
ncbi:hypothetical protein [Eubacterium ruminantium]|uniref:hypothetical protein n=1 Tax=Eubacterium ruminantium TaxID=42322 RepID=UPI001569FF90|nr:hypothetical protein [Eubacterium ruminantium]